MSAINAAQELANWTRRLSGMYAKDLKAISDEIYVASQGGVSRTLHDITAEVAGFNLMVAELLNGGGFDQPSEEARAAFKTTVGTTETGCAAIISSGEALASSIEGAGDKLSENITAPWGETMSLFGLATIASSHIMYHDGQITYVQSLHGDGAMHWMD